MAHRPELSLVIPIYNEEEVLPQLDLRLKELLTKLAVDAEVVFVNDGSKDKSIEILRRMASHELRYKVLSFSRNFGHQRAITAGMEKSRGRAVVVMDADLQDPPEVILEMVERWKQGFDVVYGRRRSREGESFFKLFTAKIFYRVFAALIPIEVPLDTGDFRLMSRRVVTTMRGLRETHRFVRGLVAWVGFKQTAVEYDRAARAAGETKYPLKKMIQFAVDGIASFSIQPLRFATYTGAIVGTVSVLYAIAAILSWLAGLTVPGWTTVVVLVSFLFSVQFFMIGVLGEYVGRIYEQVKRRPLYIISERINFKQPKVKALVTRDLEVLSADGSPPALPPPPLPPPPPAPAPYRPSAAPPKLPPPRVSSSVANIHAAPPKAPSGAVTTETARPSTPPKFPTVKPAAKTDAASPSIPPPPKAPSIPPPRKETPSLAPPRPLTASIPPPAGQKSPSMAPPRPRSPSVPAPTEIAPSPSVIPPPRKSVPSASELFGLPKEPPAKDPKSGSAGPESPEGSARGFGNPARVPDDEGGST